MTKEVLRMYNIYSWEGNINLIQNGNFHLFEGEVVGLVGNNHSGKSAFMGAVTGEFPCKSGKIWISENIKRIDSIERARKGGVFLIKDESSLIEEFSIRDTMKLNYGLAEKGVGYQDYLKKCKEIFHLLNISDAQNLKMDYDCKIRDMTFHQRVLIEIAQAMVCNAKIIVMDSVVGMLSQSARVRMREVFCLLVNRGISIVLIENQIECIRIYLNRLCVMRKGKVVAELNSSEVDANLVSTLMEGEKRELQDTVGGDCISEACKAKAILKFDGVFTSQGILNGLSLTLYEGETLGIWNKNRHSGTAIAQILQGEMPFVKGAITIGNEAFLGQVGRTLKPGLAVLPESDQLFTNMSIGENISISALRQNSYGKVVMKEGELRYITQNLVEEYFDNGKYKTFIDQIVFESLIIKKKISLCRAIASGAGIFVYSNPFSHLDEGERKLFSQDIQKTAQKGISQIIISAHAEMLYSVCSRILEIERGVIVRETVSPTGGR